MDGLLQDLRYSVRQLLRSPGFAAVAVLTLALGIGANTAIFSLVDAVLLRPLQGVEDPDRLVGITPNGIPYPTYRDFRDGNQVFSGLAAFAPRTFSLGSGAHPELISGSVVSGNYFQVVGVGAAHGRTLLPEDDSRGERVAVLSYGRWQRSFGSAPDVVGKTVALNGRSFIIVGVAPQAFGGTAVFSKPDIWIPIGAWPQVTPGSFDGLNLEERGWGWLSMIGRLRPGIALPQAQANLDALAHLQRETYPDEVPSSFRVAVHPASVAAAGVGARGGLLLFGSLLMAAVALVLLVACANLAGLLVARAAKRRREIGVRLALGAGRGRLVRQLLTESVLLSLVAGGVGVLVAAWSMELLAGLANASDLVVAMPKLALDSRVLAYALLVSVATGIVFGLAPALHASRPELLPALKDQLGSGGNSTSRLRSSLVGAQVALSLLLLVGAGLFARTLQKAVSVDLGFEPDHVALASVNLGLQRYTAPQAERFQQTVSERVASLPGVRSVSWATDVPLTWETNEETFSIPGHQPRSDGSLKTELRAVGAGYFATLGIPVLRGREFADQDVAGSPGVVIVNEALARKYWPNENPIGKSIVFGSESASPRTVVGVASNSKQHSVQEQAEPFAYLPLSQTMESWGLGGTTLIVRTSGDPTNMLGALRAEIRALDPRLPIFGLETLRDHLGVVLLPQRAGASLLGAFGLLALVLAAIGIYGVVAYGVAQRTREIGIRVALGAGGWDAITLVLRSSLVAVGAGTIVGLMAAAAATRVLSSFLYEISPTDPLAFGGAAALIVATALPAGWLPARRATRVDPIVALRAE